MGTEYRRVLIVDDDASLRELLSQVLTEEGYAVQGAAGGQEGLAMMKAWRPDLILLDVRMPGMDGWAFLAEHRQDGFTGIPVLVLTAGSYSERTVGTLDVTVIPKPFDLEHLLAQVHRLACGRARETRDSQAEPPTGL